MIELKGKYTYLWFLLLLYYVVNIYSLWKLSSTEGIVRISSDRGFILNQVVGGVLILASILPLWVYRDKILSVELFKRIFFFLVFLLFYAFFYSRWEGIANLAALSKIYVWMLAPFSLYLFFLQIPDMRIVKIFVMVVLVYVLLNVVISLHTFALDDSLRGANIGSYLLTIVPLCFLFFKKKQFFWLFLFCVFLALLSGKRMAVLGMGLMAIFFVKDLWSEFSRKGILGFIIVIALIVFLIPYVEPYVDRMIERNEMDQEQGSYGSGRSVIFPIVWNSFMDSNAFEFLFGHGVGGTTALISKTYGIEIAAHNAFLELLYNYGLMGLVLYLSLFGSLIKLCLWFKVRGCKKYAKALMANIIIWTLLSFISHGFVGIGFMPMAIIWAFLLSRKKIIIKYQKIKSLRYATSRY